MILSYKNEISRDTMYVKGYGFLPFAKNTGKNLSNKYSQKLPDSAKKSTTDTIKTASKRAIQKTAAVTGDLIGNKIADKITSVSKKSPKELQNDEMEAPKKEHISRRKAINYWWIRVKYNNTIMEYQKIANLSDNGVALNASNQPSKFRK